MKDLKDTTKKELAARVEELQASVDEQSDIIEKLSIAAHQTHEDRQLEGKTARIHELRREVQKLKTHILITQNQADPMSWPLRILNRLFPNDPTYSLDQLRTIAQDRYPGTISQFNSLRSFVKTYFYVRSLNRRANG